MRNILTSTRVLYSLLCLGIVLGSASSETVHLEETIATLQEDLIDLQKFVDDKFLELKSNSSSASAVDVKHLNDIRSKLDEIKALIKTNEGSPLDGPIADIKSKKYAEAAEKMTSLNSSEITFVVNTVFDHKTGFEQVLLTGKAAPITDLRLKIWTALLAAVTADLHLDPLMLLKFSEVADQSLLTPSTMAEDFKGKLKTSLKSSLQESFKEASSFPNLPPKNWPQRSTGTAGHC